MKKARVNKTPVYRATEHVMSNPEKSDKTTLQKQLRKVFNEDPNKFFAIYRGERAAHVREKEIAQKNRKEAKVDTGTDKCLALVDQLLKEWEHGPDVEPGEPTNG